MMREIIKIPTIMEPLMRKGPVSHPPPLFIQRVTDYKRMLERVTGHIDKTTFHSKTKANWEVKIDIDPADTY